MDATGGVLTFRVEALKRRGVRDHGRSSALLPGLSTINPDPEDFGPFPGCEWLTMGAVSIGVRSGTGSEVTSRQASR
jgi:hypothetical protein